MVRPRTLLCTGKTEQQWIDEMRVLEFAEEHSTKKPRVRTRYLCKRAAGENSLLVSFVGRHTWGFLFSWL